VVAMVRIFPFPIVDCLFMIGNKESLLKGGKSNGTANGREFREGWKSQRRAPRNTPNTRKGRFWQND